MMSDEEEKILNEDVNDLFDRVDSVLIDYISGYRYKYKDKAIIAMLANVVGKYIKSYEEDDDRMTAINIFLKIIEMYLKN